MTIHAVTPVPQLTTRGLLVSIPAAANVACSSSGFLNLNSTRVLNKCLEKFDRDMLCQNC